MLTATERREMIAKIRELPSIVELAVEGLSDEQLDTPYREGGWTVRQVAHHLADSHMNAFARMKLVLTEDKPTLKTYEQDEWAKLSDGSKLPIQPSLSILRGLHERWTMLLESVSEPDWQRSATHPEQGVVTLDDLLGIYASHGENHVAQITGLRQTKAW